MALTTVTSETGPVHVSYSIVLEKHTLLHHFYAICSYANNSYANHFCAFILIFTGSCPCITPMGCKSDSCHSSLALTCASIHSSLRAFASRARAAALPWHICPALVHPCCAVLCSAVLCCAMHTVLCRAVLCVLCCAEHAVPCCAVLCSELVICTF